jgi:hypothetical protein
MFNPALVSNVNVKTAKKIDASSNTAAVITIPADTDQFWGLWSILWSYDGDPTGGKVTVAFDGTTVMEFDITTGGPGQAIFDQLLHHLANKGEALVITLAAAGSGVTGKITVQYS